MGYGSPRVKDVELAGRGVRAPPPYPPPLKDPSWVPWLVPLFAIANVAAFAYSLYINDCIDIRVDPDQDGCLFPSLGRFAFEPLSVNPLLGPTSQTLDSLGALNYKKVVNDREGWRLFTCIWLHAGVVHLLANMFSLVFVGIRLEQEFGFVRIGMLYIISGLGGSLVSCFSIRTNISVGASGALFGFLGSMLSELITNWTIYANKCAALMTLVLVISINLAVSMVPHVDSSAHLGGFACGFLLGFVLLIRPQYGWISQKHIPPGYSMNCRKPKYKTYQYLLWIIAMVLLIIGFLSGFISLYHT